MVVIAARNEAGNLSSAYAGVRRALDAGRFARCEILIVDDGSTDATPDIARRVARQDDAVRLVRHETSRGFGASFDAGLRHASTKYLAVVPGDDEIAHDSVAAILGAAGTADVVTAYSANPEIRPYYRCLLSRAFTGLVNGLFSHRLRYYNGPNVYRVSQVKPLAVDTSSFIFNAELVLRLLEEGRSVHEVEMRLRPQPGRKTRAFEFRNIRAVIKRLFRLFYELRIRERRR